MVCPQPYTNTYNIQDTEIHDETCIFVMGDLGKFGLIFQMATSEWGRSKYITKQSMVSLQAKKDKIWLRVFFTIYNLCLDELLELMEIGITAIHSFWEVEYGERMIYIDMYSWHMMCSFFTTSIRVLWSTYNQTIAQSK